ncbi:hypothetical protein HYW83_03915 [Candidatus Peregrinibacteria bacterium]|nr:hypothetical protein [Candidatus Peregrinibacteria bacterium]
MRQRMQEREVIADRYRHELYQRFASVNLRKVHDMREAIAELVAAAGGPELLRERFRSRNALDIALTDIDFTGLIAKARLNADFYVPFGEIPHTDTDDPDCEGLTIVQVIQGVIAMQIQEGILKAVFPHARERRAREKKAPAVSAAVARKGNGV